MQLSLGTDTPKIYVACLAAYNAGILHGEWIDAAQEIDDLGSAIRNILASSPVEMAEEWAIHDFEGFGMHRLSEYESIEHVQALAEFIEEHEGIGTGLIEHFCGDLEDAKQALENYLGPYESLKDYAREITEETTQIPEHLSNYIDYEAMARDIDLDGDVFTISLSHNQVHIFANL